MILFTASPILRLWKLLKRDFSFRGTNLSTD